MAQPRMTQQQYEDSLRQRQGEPDADFQRRIREEPYRQYDRAVSAEEAARKSGNAAYVLAAAALILFLMAITGFYWNHQSGSKLAAAKARLALLEPEVKRLQGENATLASKKVELTCPGPSAEEINKIVGEKCVGKPVTITKWRERPVAAAPMPTPGCGTNCPGDRVRVTVQPDRCIFRIHGEIKATTEFPGGTGAAQCPQWRDAMLKKYNQNPADKIWERKYPSSNPL